MISVNPKITIFGTWRSSVRLTSKNSFLIVRCVWKTSCRLSKKTKISRSSLLSSHSVWSSSRQIYIVTLRISWSLLKMSWHSVCSHDLTSTRRIQRLTRRSPLSWEAPLLQKSHGTADVCPDRFVWPCERERLEIWSTESTDRFRIPSHKGGNNCAVASRLRTTPPLTARDLESEAREQSVRSRNSSTWTWKVYAMIRNHFFEKLKTHPSTHERSDAFTKRLGVYLASRVKAVFFQCGLRLRTRGCGNRYVRNWSTNPTYEKLDWTANHSMCPDASA